MNLIGVKWGVCSLSYTLSQDPNYTFFHNVVLFLWNFLSLSFYSQPLILGLCVILPFSFLLPTFCTLFFWYFHYKKPLIFLFILSIIFICFYPPSYLKTSFFYTQKKKKTRRLQNLGGFLESRWLCHFPLSSITYFQRLWCFLFLLCES